MAMNNRYNEEIKCNHCDRVLTEPTPVNDCYLQLAAVETPYDGTATFDMNILAPINGDKYFCNLKCLYLWCKNQPGSMSKGQENA